jgi:hypothetical protein
MSEWIVSVTVRVYWLKEALLNGAYKVPPLRKA